MISQEEEMRRVVAMYGGRQDALPVRIVRFLHSLSVQLFLMLLFLLDVIIVLVELYVDQRFPPCFIVVQNAISCCNVSHAHNELLLPVDDDKCGGGLHAVTHKATCDDYSDHRAHVHVIHTAFFVIVMMVLAIFALELLLLLAIEGRLFFRNGMYVFDLIMVSVALALDITLKLNDSDTEGLLSTMLSWSRLWRFARIGHAILFMHSKQEDLQRIELVAEQRLASLRTAGSQRLRGLSGKLSSKLSGKGSRKKSFDACAEGSFKELGDDAPDNVEIGSLRTLEEVSRESRTEDESNSPVTDDLGSSTTSASTVAGSNQDSKQVAEPAAHKGVDEVDQKRHPRRSAVRFESAAPSSEPPPPPSPPPPEPPPSPPSSRLTELQRNVHVLEKRLAAAKRALEVHTKAVESSGHAKY